MLRLFTFLVLALVLSITACKDSTAPQKGEICPILTQTYTSPPSAIPFPQTIRTWNYYKVGTSGAVWSTVLTYDTTLSPACMVF